MRASRRTFLKYSAAWAGGMVTAATLRALTKHSDADGSVRGGEYGDLTPVADQHGDAILALPRGFKYVTFSKAGAPMTDGNATPASLDGMATFPGRDGRVRLIRNHELRNSPDDRSGAVEGPEGTRYDSLGVGGAVTVDFDPRSLTDPRRYPPVTRDFISLNGTIVNCAGGYALGDTAWISCEETVKGPADGWRRPHGYAFLVPAAAETAVVARPILGMGRFPHEAAVADPASGIVYQTEDSDAGSGFYRFLPRDPSDLFAGGRLEMLRVVDRPEADLRWGQTVGARLPVAWVTIEDPDPDLEHGAASTFEQGFARDGAMFSRLEGIFRGERGAVYFASTSGGGDGATEGFGQLWRYLPDARELVLVFESPRGDVLDGPDNIWVTPRGSILICEESRSLDGSGKRLVGLTPEREPFTLAANLLNDSEFAGVCFSPDGNIVFVNIYGDGVPGSGMTCAITGPWCPL